MTINLISDTSTKLLLFGIVIHLFCDWILQNHYLAQNKSNLLHPAAWIHSGFHLIGIWFIFPGWMALLIALSHLLIDTHVPLQWWRKFYKQTAEGPVAIDVALWSDQVAHITILAIAALIAGGMK